MQVLVHDEGDHQQQPRRQEAADQARIEPVQAIALVQGGIDQRQADAAGGQAEAIGLGDDGNRRVRLGAPLETDEHTQGQGHVLPEDPAPGEVVDVPALQGCGDVERELQVQGVQGDAIGPQPRLDAAQDEAEGERDEEARGDAAAELQGQQHRQVGRERRQEGNHGVSQGGLDEHAPGPEDGAQPDGEGQDQHLGHRLGGGDPGAVVETGVDGAADVVEAEGGEPAVQRRDEGAEQDRGQAEPGDRLAGRGGGRGGGRCRC